MVNIWLIVVFAFMVYFMENPIKMVTRRTPILGNLHISIAITNMWLTYIAMRYMEVSWVMEVPPVLIHFEWWDFPLQKPFILKILATPRFRKPQNPHFWSLHQTWSKLDFQWKLLNGTRLGTPKSYIFSQAETASPVASTFDAWTTKKNNQHHPNSYPSYIFIPTSLLYTSYLFLQYIYICK